MFKLKETVVCGVIAASAAGAAWAQEFVPFGEAGGWKVFTKTDDNTCVIESNKDGLIVQMGILKSGLGYIGAFTHEPDGATTNGGTQLIIDIDGKLFYAPENVMHNNSQGYSGAYIAADNPDFISSVANGQTMKVLDDQRQFVLDLTGTKAAMTKGQECLAAAG